MASFATKTVERLAQNLELLFGKEGRKLRRFAAVFAPPNKVGNMQIKFALSVPFLSARASERPIKGGRGKINDASNVTGGARFEEEGSNDADERARPFFFFAN